MEPAQPWRLVDEYSRGLTSKFTYEVDSFDYKYWVVDNMRENITRQTKFRLTYQATLERENILVKAQL